MSSESIPAHPSTAETNETPTRDWEKTLEFGAASLKGFANSALKESIDTSSEDFKTIFKLAGKSLDNLSYHPSDPDTLFVRMNIDDMDGDTYTELKKSSTFLGYGISHNRLGFCRGTNFVKETQNTAIYNHPDVSFFVPYPITESMRVKSED
ncbi:MAG: hypothetical protein MUF19_02795 [Candidatus Pacebacteria bacterium]|jgi:hypothetical protein|nr:hypothetical protein [Candidatus Paceibacterota bacterium]